MTGDSIQRTRSNNRPATTEELPKKRSVATAAFEKSPEGRNTSDLAPRPGSEESPHLDSVRISEGLKVTELSPAQVQLIRRRDGRPLPAHFSKVRMIESVDQRESGIAFERLTVDCPRVWEEIRVPLILRVSASGELLEAQSMQGATELPRGLFSCRFSGGPNSRFRTLFTPQALRKH